MRYIGALVIIAAAYVLGCKLAEAEKGVLKCYDSLIKFFSYALARIETGKTPLRDILSGFSDEYLEECGFLPELRSSRADISSVFCEIAKGFPVSDIALREMLLFGPMLGKISCEEQIMQFKALNQTLASERAKYANTLPGKEKSTKTVCLLVGLLAAIIML